MNIFLNIAIEGLLDFFTDICLPQYRIWNHEESTLDFSKIRQYYEKIQDRWSTKMLEAFSVVCILNKKILHEAGVQMTKEWVEKVFEKFSTPEPNTSSIFFDFIEDLGINNDACYKKSYCVYFNDKV